MKIVINYPLSDNSSLANNLFHLPLTEDDHHLVFDSLDLLRHVHTDIAISMQSELRFAGKTLETRTPGPVDQVL